MAEKTYYDSKFNLAFGNIKKKWDFIKHIAMGYDHANSKNHHWNSSRVDNSLITDSNIIANKFNSFFSNVGPVFANNIPKTHGDIIDNMSGNSLEWYHWYQFWWNNQDCVSPEI